MVYQVAYMSAARAPLSEAGLSDILDTSKQNNARDEITGILMYHDQLFFQVLEGDRTLVKMCYARILCDPRHSAISLMWENEVEKRTFSSWSMGYAGPDEIGLYSGQQLTSLSDIPVSRDGTIKDDIALQMALQIF